MQIVEKKIEEIKPYEKNPRKNDNAVDAVASSISQFGFKNPIVIDKDGVIVCGHTRYKAAKKLGLDKVPCVVADDLTDEQIKAYRLADNKVSELAEWDIDLLGEELDGIFDIDMSDFGFDLTEEETEPINDEQLENTASFEYTLKFGKTTVIMTEEEYNELLDRYNEYSKENGVSFGFVSSLLNGVS